MRVSQLLIGRIGQTLYRSDPDACETGVHDLVQIADGHCVRFYPGVGCLVGEPWNGCSGLGRIVFTNDINCGPGVPVTAVTDGRGVGSYACGGNFRDTNANVGLPCTTADTNPCNVATGNKYQSETDYVAANGQLRLVRHYNSASTSGAMRSPG